MSSVGSSPPANLFVGTQSIALETADGVMRLPMEEPLQEIVNVMSQVPRQRWRRPAIRVWLSGGLCRAFLLEVAEGLNDDEELRLLAAGVAPNRTGFGSACRVWVEPARGRKRLVVVAMEEAVAQRITSASESAGVALVGMSAWWSAPQRALCRRLPVGSRPVLLVQDEDSLTILRDDGDSGFEDALTWFPVADHESAGALRQRWEIEGAPWHARLDLDAGPEGARDERFAFDRWTRVSP